MCHSGLPGGCLPAGFFISEENTDGLFHIYENDPGSFRPRILSMLSVTIFNNGS